MCEVLVVTKGGVSKHICPSLDAVMDLVSSIQDLKAYRCYQVYGTKRTKKVKELKRGSR